MSKKRKKLEERENYCKQIERQMRKIIRKLSKDHEKIVKKSSIKKVKRVCRRINSGCDKG